MKWRDALYDVRHPVTAVLREAALRYCTMQELKMVPRLGSPAEDLEGVSMTVGFSCPNAGSMCNCTGACRPGSRLTGLTPEQAAALRRVLAGEPK